MFPVSGVYADAVASLNLSLGERGGLSHRDGIAKGAEEQPSLSAVMKKTTHVCL